MLFIATYNEKKENKQKHLIFAIRLEVSMYNILNMRHDSCL